MLDRSAQRTDWRMHAPTVVCTTYCACPTCSGRGVIIPRVDDGTLVAAIAIAVGARPFTVGELKKHATVVGGELLQALDGRSAQQLGKLFERLAKEATVFDGCSIIRLELDRCRVALWRITFA